MSVRDGLPEEWIVSWGEEERWKELRLPPNPVPSLHSGPSSGFSFPGNLYFNVSMLHSLFYLVLLKMEIPPPFLDFSPAVPSPRDSAEDSGEGSEIREDSTFSVIWLPPA